MRLSETMPVACWDHTRAAAIISAHAGLQGATLPMLHALQEAFGYIDDDAVPLIAETLNLSRAEILGTISFYHDFRRSPAGRHVVKLCRAEACQAAGCEPMHAHAMLRLGVGWHGTTADGDVTLEPVFCLGLCARGPAALIDDEPVALFDAAALDAVLDGFAA
jgi:formate dehydrogenase subunit gamma